MHRSERLCHRELRALYTLLAEVTQLGHDPHAWRHHALEKLCALTGARVGLSLELNNVRPRQMPVPVDPIDVGFVDELERSYYLRYITSNQRALDPSVETLSTLQPHRRFLTFHRHAVLDDRIWYESPTVSEARRFSGIDHFLCSMYRLGHLGSTTGFILYRRWGDAPFEERSRRLVRLFHAELLKKTLRSDPASPGRLPPHLAQCLEHYLAGRSVKETAERLGLASNTVKSYTKALFERAGVRSRTELMDHYLNRLGPRPVLLPGGLNR